MPEQGSPQSATSPAPSKWRWLKEKALLPLVLVIASVGAVDTYIGIGNRQAINQLSQEVQQSETLRGTTTQNSANHNEEAGENPIEMFYDELATHASVEEEARLLLEAKLSALEKHIKGDCIEEDRTLLMSDLSVAKDDVAKLKKESPPGVEKKAISTVHHLEKRVHNKCF
jgi:hypothetical protein